jgi:hypothetical protein
VRSVKRNQVKEKEENMSQESIYNLIQERSFITLQEIYSFFSGELSERSIREAISKLVEHGEIKKITPTDDYFQRVFVSIETFQVMHIVQGEEICMEELRKLAQNSLKH